MQRHDIPDAATGSGLSTDDIAQPRDRRTADTDDTASTRSEVPTFPGEGTTLAGESAEREDVKAESGPPAEDVEADSRPAAEDTKADSGPSPEATADSSDARDEATADSSGARDEARGSDAGAEDEIPQLLSAEDEEGFRARWQEVQSKFVDDPRDAVNTADALVADVMQRLAATFADHKQELEGQWNRGEQADTEDLRLALRHYRSFFNRLLVT
ncbi:hypothetical protein [Streptomyces sp. NBC_00996]|uniref:hypothetical protein n=1 Tax=Streptomyces sp. NBC_00996 TaxID=2903710 RepID=UPI00386BA927|nr:hypothetical protein OG390_20560 [Streptomyces sp. NBC_00996]